MKKIVALFFIFVSSCCIGQDKSKFHMEFPNIYFKNQTTEYAEMPYSIESCFKFIKTYIKEIKGYAMSRDSSETDALSKQRIIKIKKDLNKFIPSEKINIMLGFGDRISQKIIDKGVGYKEIQFLLSLNSVFEPSPIIDPSTTSGNRSND